MRKLVLCIVAFAAVTLAQQVSAFQSVSWTDNEGTFILDLDASTWSFNEMSGGIGSVEESNGAIFFDGFGEAGVMGYVFGNEGRAIVQTNNGTFLVSGPIR
jgi:hypothetical protein